MREGDTERREQALAAEDTECHAWQSVTCITSIVPFHVQCCSAPALAHSVARPVILQLICLEQIGCTSSIQMVTQDSYLHSMALGSQLCCMFSFISSFPI